MKSTEILLGTVNHNSVIHFIIGSEHIEGVPVNMKGCSCFRWKINEDGTINVAMSVGKLADFRNDMAMKHKITVNTKVGEADHQFGITIRFLITRANVNLNP